MEIWFAPIFDKTFKKLDKLMKELAIREIERLKTEPNLGEPLSGILEGLRSLYIKGHSSNCRVVYKISKDNKRIIIIAAGTHAVAYQWLGNYIRNVLKRPASTAFEP